jgi:spore maturation protein A
MPFSLFKEGGAEMVSTAGKLFRYLLNINTIWGAMIVVSLLAAGLQHFRPTTSWIAPERWQEGTNQVEIQLTDPEGEIYKASFTVDFDGTSITVPSIVEEPEADEGTPWLIGSTSKAGMPGLIWDSHKHGKFQILVNDRQTSTGQLITLRSVTDAPFDYAKVAFDLGLGFVSVFVLFLGLMKVGEESGMVQAAAFVLRPVIKFLFPGIPKNHPANGAIVMNIATSIIGLGNAATPFGLKAMEEMQKLNPRKDTASDAMCMLLGYNTAGFALLPTTLLALRKSAGCSDPFAVIGTCMIAGLSSTITALVMVKLLGSLPICKVQYTAEEMASVAEALQRTVETDKAKKENADE